MRKICLGLFVAAMAYTGAAQASDCVPPKGFVDAPRPEIGSPDYLAAHTEEIVVDRPLEETVATTEHMPLAKTVRKTDSLPGVTGTYLLTRDFKSFGAPGSRQFDCLSDGSTLEEQSLVVERTPSLYHFRYEVWNYTTEQARPIAYAVGEFVYTPVDARHTRIHWTYSFALRPDRFPGFLGMAGRFLFHIGFLDTQYAELMRNVLAGIKQTAETK